MPGGRTKFQVRWLESRDKNGDFISNWCTKGRDENEAYCTLCRSYFSISNSGFSQLLQHSAGQKHLSAAKTLRGQLTLLGNLKCTNEAKPGTSSESINLLQLNNDQMVARAEALWAMKVAISNFSFASSKDIVLLFQTMFEGHPVAKHMSLGERKISYILSHGLGPYFREELIVSDLKTSGSWYTLAFDETTTSQIKKQLDIYVQFWSAKSAKIVNAYQHSIFLGHADSDKIYSSIINALNESKLPLAKILMLSMDGPYVNLSVAKKLNAELMKANSAELVNIGTCSLHKVHNCFSKAVSSLPFDTDQFATDLFSFFKCSAARREDLKDLQKLLDCEQKFLLRHVSSRWLTLGPVVKRILLVYPSLLEYFLKFLPKQKSNATLPQNSRYLRIIACLKDKLTVAYLEFISDLSSIFESYLTLFQNEGPLIHLLYNKMNGLVRSIMVKFLKQDRVGILEGLSLKSIMLEDPENHLSMKEIDIGVGARRAISQLKECERTRTRVEMQKCLFKLTKCLIESLPISDTILRDLEVLHPLMRTDSSDNAVHRLCLAMKVLKLADQTIDCIVREWQVYRVDPDVPKICDEFCAVEKGVSEHEIIKYQRLDVYWAKILKLNDKFTGKLKYENLSKLIKCCLSLSHSNADIERGFSLNNAIVTSDRPNISECVIIGIRLVKDAVSRHGNIFNVPITGKLLKSIAKAHSEYAESKKKLQEENQKRVHDSDESSASKKLKIEKTSDFKMEIKKQIKCLQEELVSAQALLNEGNERLAKGVKRKDFKEINVASAMIDSGTVKVNVLTTKLKEAQDKESSLISVSNQLCYDPCKI